MGPRRETSERAAALEGVDWLVDVEEDVEKKRHVKNPFRDAYVALVAAPFDAFLAKNERQREVHHRDDEDVDMQCEEDMDAEEDPASLQREISARSQQVHLRLEILRRQMQCLVEESSAVLDTRALEPKREASKRTRCETQEVEAHKIESSTECIADLEKLLERAALYENGELTDHELQKTWTTQQCSCKTHDIVGADEKLERMKAIVDEEYQAIREQQLLSLGPRLLLASESNMAQTPPDAETARFLEECKKSIKPFFLEDFIQQDESQIDGDSQSNETGDNDEELDGNSLTQIAAEVQYIEEDATMLDNETRVESSGRANNTLYDEDLPVQAENDLGASSGVRAESICCIASIRESRRALHKQAAEIRTECDESRRLPVRASRQSVSSLSSKKTIGSRRDTPPLLSDPKQWKNLSMSIIDPAVNLVQLRTKLCECLTLQPDQLANMPINDPVRPVGCQLLNFTSIDDSNEPSHSQYFEASVQSDKPIAQHKRQLQVDRMPQNKKSRVDEVQAKRPLTLRTIMASIHEVFCRVAKSACVSFLSMLLRSQLGSTSPQRAFVALVFSASLVNTNQATPQSTDKPLQVTLYSVNAGRDVKIVCKQE